MKEKRRKGKNQYSPESKRKLGYTGNAYIETEKDREGLDTRARGEKDDICCSLDTTFTFHPLLTILPPSSFSGNTLPLILTAPVSKHYWTIDEHKQPDHHTHIRESFFPSENLYALNGVDLNLLAEIGAEPLETLVKTVSGSSASGLDILENKVSHGIFFFRLGPRQKLTQALCLKLWRPNLSVISAAFMAFCHNTLASNVPAGRLSWYIRANLACWQRPTEGHPSTHPR